MKTDLLFVYRNAAHGDCTNHGITSRIDKGIMFWGCTREEALAYCDEHPNINPNDCFFLVNRDLFGEDHSYAEPLIKPANAAQTMGGNFIYTSNGGSFKFRGESVTRPIPVHDRFESWDMFYAMSV